jgi:hypothetical protein
MHPNHTASWLRRSLFFVASCVLLFLWLLGAGATAAQAQGVATGGSDWIWHSPLPQGNTLHDVWGADATHVWAVGDAGAILFWDGAAWRGQDGQTTAALRGVWGLDASHVWVVGDGGVIRFWDGAAWQVQRAA